MTRDQQGSPERPHDGNSEGVEAAIPPDETYRWWCRDCSRWNCPEVTHATFMVPDALILAVRQEAAQEIARLKFRIAAFERIEVALYERINAIERERDALRSQDQGWLPMESAPKEDMNSVLGCRAVVGDQEVRTMHWDSKFQSWIKDRSFGNYQKWEPTHWKPLPPLPAPPTGGST